MFYSIFDQINAALVSTRDCIQKQHQKSYYPNFYLYKNHKCI